MKRLSLLLLVLSTFVCSIKANPADDLLERIEHGASRKFKTQLVKADRDFFELDQSGSRVVVRGNSWVNIATGINWYLKYHAGIHLSWNGMHARLPEVLPSVRHRAMGAGDRLDGSPWCEYAFGDCG